MRSPSADWREATDRLLTARPPGDVVAAARAALQDHVASSLLARDEPPVRRLLDHAVRQGVPASPVAVLGHATGLAPGQAALVGGFAAHLLDVDDTHEDVRGHPSAVLFPALLALSTPGTSVTRLLEAYAVGVEVMARLGRALGASHYEAGWHPTGTAGTIAAAAAGAYLRALPTEEAARAVSLAASQAGGLRFQFGTEAKPLHAGLAAQSAVQAVQLAIAGVTANPDFLDPRAGFLAAHGVGPGLDELTAPCGPRWRLLDPGLWFKQYPYCSAAMSAGDAAAGLATWVAGADIDHVVVRVPPGADTALRHTRPATGEEGRFSLEYVVALRLTDTAPDSASLGPRPVAAALDALVIRTSREHVTPPPSAGRSFWAEVEVTLGDGRRRAVAVEHPTGSPRAPLTVEQHRAKLVTATGSPHAADAVGAALADAATVGSLMTAVANAVGATDPRPDPRSPNQEGPR